MSANLQAVRGMKDVLPDEVGYWQRLESVARELLAAYGYQEFRVPILEHTELFKRAIGEYTDVVEKEMYTFLDQGRESDGVSLTLRPEATAGMVRAVISNGLLRGARHKLWCLGPMFRHERPQAGRFRQFHQIDVEAIGFTGPDIDIELLALTARLWKRLGIENTTLQINSLGTPASRTAYREQLTRYFGAQESALDTDSRRRLSGNPLRILDSKNPQMQALIAAAPTLTDSLDAESRAHFAELCAALDDLGIPYRVNPRLVRGLDYYSRTVFEWTTTALGSQDAICSGGRYDGLIAQLGGEATPAIGFALGMERVITLMQQVAPQAALATADVYVVAQGTTAGRASLKLAEQLRDALPQLRVETNLAGGNFKAQFRRADRSGARLALILGDDELQRGIVSLKSLRNDSASSAPAEQREVPLAAVAAAVREALAV
jgi:histidyl-tRNA synthetase